MNTYTNPAFVFIHGAWHNANTWNKVIPLLAKRGFASVAIDLPGAGENAQLPASYHQRPLDPVAFATEPSPNAGVTQEERNAATLAAIEEAASLGNGQVVLVGHSLGGITLSPVAQMAPEQLHAVVYLTAFMLPHGMPCGAMIMSEAMAEALVPSLFMADPQVVGALRLDTNSDDPGYIERARQAFYGDLSDADFETALSNLHCDEPAQVLGVPSPITSDQFGTVTRHYIRCTEDRAITLVAQDEMIDMVDQEMGNQTIVHTLDASHSPFYSQPEELVEIFVQTAA